MYRYIREREYDFTRSRPFHKNDNAHTEQKNWTAIRQLVGYSRLDKLERLEILNDLYRNEWRLYQNFFPPIMKLEEKIKNTETGGIKKKYDQAKTPYQRPLLHDKIPQGTKDMLKQIYKGLNPIQLRRRIKVKINRLKRTLK